MRLTRTLLLFFVACVLAGCGAKPKKVEPPPPVKRVGIVSLLPSNLSYQKFGVTKFNNETTERPVGEVFNVAARAGALSGLRMASRSVLQLDVDTAKLARSMQDYPGSIEVKVEQIEDDMLALIEQHKLDAIVLIVELIEKDKPMKGVRVVFRAGFGSVDKVEAQPHIAMLSLDKNAKRTSITTSITSTKVSHPSDKEWEYRLEENLTSATHDHLTKILQTAIESEVEQGVMSLNF